MEHFWYMFKRHAFNTIEAGSTFGRTRSAIPLFAALIFLVVSGCGTTGTGGNLPVAKHPLKKNRPASTASVQYATDNELPDSEISAISIKFMPLKDINLDTSGNPLSVVVRVYQLSGRQSFQNADIHSLWSNDQAVLGSSFVMKQELTVHPSQCETLTLEPEGNARYIGIAAFFRQPSGNKWQKVLSFPTAGRKNTVVKLSNGSLH